tara:strand:- start:2241 stop:2765 length:525 start_codon:yes stop_codon:yes gene_type:complete
MSIFNQKEKNILDDIIKEHKIEDNTDYVINNKKASIIRKEFNALLKIKQVHGHEKINLSRSQAPYLYKNYKSIFDKIIKEDFNIALFKDLIDILEKIENKKIDLNEGSFIFGKKLKNIFVDKCIYNNSNNNSNSLNKDLSNNLNKDLSNNLNKDLSNNVNKDLSYKKYKSMNKK